VLVVLAFAALWMVGFGWFRVANPRLLAVLCVLPALFQYGERAGANLLSEHYANLRSMMWISVPQFARLGGTPVLRRTRSGLDVYVIAYPDFDTPLPNVRDFNPYLQLRTNRMKDGFRNTADSVPYGEKNHKTLAPFFEACSQKYSL
jgi:hypothetical protein